MYPFGDWHGWDKTLGLLQIQGKSVIDVGAGSADSVTYFLDHGAMFVYAYEANESERQKLLDRFASDPRVEVHGAWNGEPLPYASILKMDCEGCEQRLTVAELGRFSQWVVAIHSWQTPWMSDMLSSLGGEPAYITPDQRELVFVKA